jgi:hypothetical protein
VATAGNGRLGTLSVTGGSNVDFSLGESMIPQFYSEGAMSLYVHNSGTPYTGIFGTLSDAQIFNNAPSSAEITGLVVGNCTGAQARTVAPFNSGLAMDMIMDGGIFDILEASSGGSATTLTPGQITITNFNTVTQGLPNLRETTGE